MMITSLQTRIRGALQLLEKHQGIKSWLGPSDPLDSLMLTFLSQNTNDTLRDKAYSTLRQRYPTWNKVMQAPTLQVQEAIRIAGLSQQKAARMQDFLRWVKSEFGKLTLQTLEEMPEEEAIELLTSQKGVGIKTAAVVLMAALGRDLCPVDTHVHRIAQRLGWAPARLPADKAFIHLRSHIPPGKGFSLHMNLLQFGRTICLARSPLCYRCFLYSACTWEGKERQRVKAE